jgi:hypothetical protein
MRLTSTVAEYQRLANIEDHASRLQAWMDDYEAAHPDVFNIYYSCYATRATGTARSPKSPESHP